MSFLNLTKRIVSTAMAIIIYILCIGTSASWAEKTVDVTVEEKRYLESIGPVKLCVDPDWYPYEKITETGEYTGIAADIIEIISKRSGVEFEIVETEDWNESLDLVKEGKADALAFLNKTEDRSEWLLFTEPYYFDPNVIITREEHDYIPDISYLRGKKVVLPEGTSIGERIGRDYPELEVIKVDSEETAVEYVESRKADMTIRSLTMAAYVIKDEGLFNLKIAGQIPGYENEFRIGISKDRSMLQQILNKGIATVTPEEIEEIKNNHISINVQEGFDYKILALTVGAFLIVVLIGSAWIRQLRALNSKLEERQKELSVMGKQLSESEALYRSILNASPNAIVIFNRQGNIVMTSPATLRIIGYEEDETLEGRNLKDFIADRDKAKLTYNIDRIYSGEHIGTSEYLGVRRDGSFFNMEANSEVIKSEDGEAKEMVSIVRDITEKKKVEDELKKSEEKFRALSEELQLKNRILRERSILDQLTGIKNRRYFDQRINEEKAEADRYGTPFSLLIFDLDKFKNVNDEFGHDTGDDVIVGTVEVVKSLIRDSDTFARWGGEEFTVLMKQTDIEGAGQAAEKIRKAVESIDHPKVGKVTISIGVSQYIPGEKVESTFKRADDALYRAKREGRNRVYTNIGK